MSHDVFISYASEDKAVADAVCAKLEARGIRCWIAPRDILPGTDYGESIVTAIQNGRLMVLVFSRHSNASEHVKNEVERTVSAGKAVVPLRVEDVIPSGSLALHLSRRHWLDAVTPPLEKHLEILAQTVQALLSLEKGGARTDSGVDAVHAVPEEIPVGHGLWAVFKYIYTALKRRPAWVLGLTIAVLGFGIVYVINLSRGNIPGQSESPMSNAVREPGAQPSVPITADRADDSYLAFRDLRQARGHPVRSVSFASEGTILATGSSGGPEGHVEVWDTRTGELLHSFAEKHVSAVVFSHDAKRLLATVEGDGGVFEGHVKIWDTSDWQVTQTLSGGLHDLSAVAISPEGTLVAGAGIYQRPTGPTRFTKPGFVMAWDLQTGSVLWTVQPEDCGVHSVAFSPDGEQLASAMDDGVRVWNAQTGALIRHVRRVQGNFLAYAVAFSPTGDLLASGHSDGSIVLWDTQTWTVDRILSEQSEYGYNVTSVAFLPGGNMLASGGWDKRAKIWDLQTGALTLTLNRDDFVTAVAVSPDGDLLASSGYDGTIRVWSLPRP
jgi:WD40 repeat protein